MQVGDLVKHPKGMVNVCGDLYSCGIVLRVEHAGRNGEHMQCLVTWRGDYNNSFRYPIIHLEVISESR